MSTAHGPMIASQNRGREVTGSTQTGPMVAVRRFVEGFNADDADAVQSACADDLSIIDDFPPHEWSGRGAAATWYRDMAGMAGGYGMSDWSVTLNEPREVTVSDLHAYVIVPIDVRWLQNGAPVERNGFMTMSLRDGAGGWRISALAWTWI